MGNVKALTYRKRRPEDDAFIIETTLKEMQQPFVESVGFPLTQEMIRTQLITNDTTVVLRENKPIGYYSYAVYAPGRMYFLSIILSSNAQGRGLGRRIARHVEAEVYKKGVRIIEAHVQIANGRAIVFWLKQGYRITGLPTRGSLSIVKQLDQDVSISRRLGAGRRRTPSVVK